jgi:glutaminase
VRSILSIMFTCGMYDYSGEWAYRVGVPAKSGVAGGVIAVVNRQLGIATYSPRLDPHGNSARGIEVCVELASRFGLHAFDCLNVGSGFLQVIL